MDIVAALLTVAVVIASSSGDGGNGDSNGNGNSDTIIMGIFSDASPRRTRLRSQRHQSQRIRPTNPTPNGNRPPT